MTRPETDPDDFNPNFFDKPLRDWKNPDILYEEALNALASENDPDRYAVIDWPELRAEFDVHEQRAKRYKSRSRKLGLIALALVGGGSAFVALSPLIPELLRPAGLILALVALAFGVLLGIYHVFQKGGLHAWLGHRLKAERLRAAYFQVLLENLVLAGQAYQKHPDAMEKWTAIRSEALRGTQNRLTSEADLGWESWLEDSDLENVWAVGPHVRPFGALLAAAKQEAAADLDTAQFGLDILFERRIGVQRSFSCKASRPTVHTANGRQVIVNSINLTTTLATVALAIVSASTLVTGGTATIWLPLLGASASLGLAGRMADQGFRLTAEARRYWDYKQRVAKVERAFIDARNIKSIEGQIEAAFELERHAYWETRQFWLDHKDELFL